jgi:hypothetical protein
MHKQFRFVVNDVAETDSQCLTMYPNAKDHVQNAAGREIWHTHSGCPKFYNRNPRCNAVLGLM